MRPFTLLSSAALALLATLTSPVSGASLLAIDYGTDSFKASLVKPGVPFDVLVTKEGRRKTQSLVTLRKEDRSFGGEAANLVRLNASIQRTRLCALASCSLADVFALVQATRFPQDTFSSIKLLLGHPSSHPQSQLHQSLYSSPAGTTARGSPSISSSSASFPVEEILAMQLTYAKEMADEVAGESVRDVVVTVPGWFGQSERQAVLDATELAGLRCIGLVNDGTAGTYFLVIFCSKHALATPNLTRERPSQSCSPSPSRRQLRHDPYLPRHSFLPPLLRPWLRLPSHHSRLPQVRHAPRPLLSRSQA